jgi:hypothetical protein
MRCAFFTPNCTWSPNYSVLVFFCGGSQLWKQILWIKFHIRCAYFTPNRTWSPNYSVLVFLKNLIFFGSKFCPKNVKIECLKKVLRTQSQKKLEPFFRLCLNKTFKNNSKQANRRRIKFYVA